MLPLLVDDRTDAAGRPVQKEPVENAHRRRPRGLLLHSSSRAALTCTRRRSSSRRPASSTWARAAPREVSFGVRLAPILPELTENGARAQVLCMCDVTDGAAPTCPSSRRRLPARRAPPPAAAPCRSRPGGTCDSENRAFSCTITGHRMRQGVSTLLPGCMA